MSPPRACSSLIVLLLLLAGGAVPVQAQEVLVPDPPSEVCLGDERVESRMFVAYALDGGGIWLCQPVPARDGKDGGGQYLVLVDRDGVLEGREWTVTTTVVNTSEEEPTVEVYTVESSTAELGPFGPRLAIWWDIYPRWQGRVEFVVEADGEVVHEQMVRIYQPDA